ncbi:hypothetical protein [Aeromicrobium sp. UC242_57]|uniref:hypothetical protein n=1 Tax=Aeromicrobium sp. UC242_57 TaxID=3374624 RepID=UPI0037AE17C7
MALATQVQDAERQQAALAARKEALELGLARKDGAGALLARHRRDRAVCWARWPPC